ncbi:carcinine hydrolase/isopenicillin-N N-acyltransferase family protein [Azotosporobacter soli]|uniref:carcinine hydrolase/isopenicillin-N N-acyltransferase family protein n=1 Tax=Azotosporobacter soli TaxID=3055040 RepID=UPI0031FEEF77
MRKMNGIWMICLTFIMLAATVLPVQACTSWMASGDSVAGGGTLVVKNRDWMPGDITSLKLMKSNRDLSYFVLFGNLEGSANHGGINEAGLVLLELSTPPNTPRGEVPPLAKSFDADWILGHYRTTDEVILALTKNEWQTQPVFLIVADQNKVAYIEVGTSGRVAVKEMVNGAMIHANEYQEASMQDLNPKLQPGVDNSLALYERKRLLKAREQIESKSIFTLADMKRFAQDPVVWYEQREMRTYASFIVQHRSNGQEPLIWVRLTNPNEGVKEAQFTLSEAMSGKALELLH